MWKEHKDEHLPSWLRHSHPSPSAADGGVQETTPLLSTAAEASNKDEGGRDEDEEKNDAFSFNEKKSSKGKRTRKEECSCNRCCYSIFVLINTAAIMCQFGMLVGQILSTMYVHSDVLQIALRIYIGIFCIAFMGLEADLYLQNNYVLRTFWSRGIVYSFVGLIGVEQSIALRVDMLHMDHVESMLSQMVSLLLHLSSWAMVCMGGLYFVLGLLCMQYLRDRLFAEEQKRIEHDEWLAEHELEVE
jgi:hypothetical protein